MSTCDLVAESVWKAIESNRIVTDDQLAVFERATNIVDQRGVKRISGEPSGRSIFQIFCKCYIFNRLWENLGERRNICAMQNTCACYSSFYDVVNRGEQLCCKHQFAARLAVSTGACVDVKVSDVELALLPSKV